MNKNGEKTKLLAVIAVFAMVACALVAFAPVSEAADTTDAEATTVYVGGTGASDTADGVDLGTQDHPYATIAGALAGETSATSLIIELQADVGGDGVFLAAGSKNITINFNGYAFNMNGSLVGSTGTESQIMHLEKGNTVTLNGGTIAYAGSATGASMIIQNYSNLTINNMKLDGSKLNNSSMCYTLSINNGIVSITGNTDIIASTTTTSSTVYAFDACFSGTNYPDGAAVTLDTTGTVTGNIEVGTWTGDDSQNTSKAVLEIKNGTIAGDVMFTTDTGSGLEIAESVDVDVKVPAGKTVSGSVAFGENKVTFVDMTAGEGGITFSKGPVTIYSPDMIEGGTVTVDADTTLRIADGTKISGVTFVGTNDKSIVEVPRSAEVTFDGDVTFENVAANLKGTVTGGTIVVNEGATVTIDGTVSSAFVNKGGNIVNNAPSLGDIELKDGTTVIDQTSINGALGQDITVTGEVTVAKGGHIVSNGTLTIAEGAKLILEEGSYLAIGATGMVVNNGTIEVQAGTEDNETFRYGGSSMDVSATGAIDFQGANSFANAFNGSTGTDISVAGTVTVGEDADVNITGVTVAATGKLYVYGAANGTFVNNGTTTIDSEAGCNITVGMGNGAVLNLVNAVGTVAVNDKDMSFKYQNADKKISNPAEVTFQDVSGITVTDSLTTKVEKDTATSDPDDTTRNGYGKLCISGAAGIASNVADDLETATITVVSGTVNVAEDATLSFVKGYTLTVNGTLAVAGSVDATAEDMPINGTGTVDVTGKITADKTITTTTVNAAWYTSGTGKDAVNVYTSLATAIADGADDIDLLGNYKITENITIPANVKVNANSAITVTVDKDVTVTVAFDAATNASGKLINSSKVITVNGTLIAQNYDKSGVVQNNVVCDVIVDNEPEKKFTSIYVALDEAVAGDVINITKTGTLTITEDIVIPKDVKLVVRSDCDVVVDDGVTVTVNGTYEGESTYTMSNPKDEKDPSQTIVNGMFKVSSTWTPQMMENIDGAYYSYDGYYVISPLSVLSTVMADVESEDAKIYGTVTEGDVTLASEDDFAVVMTENAKLTLTDLTLDGVEFDFTETCRVNATVTTADGTFVLTNVMGGVITAESTIDGDNETVTATLAGDVAVTTVKLNDNEKDIEGSVVVSGTADIVDTTAGITAPVTVSKDAVVGVSDADLSDVTVEGTLNVESAGVEIAKLVVSGTVAVADKCGATVAKMFVGVSMDDKSVITDLGSGAVSGVDLKNDVAAVVYVSPNATFTATEKQDDLVSTEFYVEDALFITAYAQSNNNVTIASVKANVEDARFDAWLNADGSAVTGKYIGAPEYTEVYADITYDVYVVNIRADQNAISSISIDGNLMQFGMIGNYMAGYYYGYTITVAAGNHTVQYKLANGYSGEGVLSVLSGDTTVSGMTFTTSGTPAAGSDDTISYHLQLTGFEKSGYVPDSPDTGDSGESDSGMTITDYLLIVLVVLIIVMAIIVAMRLMRS